MRASYGATISSQRCGECGIALTSKSIQEEAVRKRPALKYVAGGLVGAAVPALLIGTQAFAEEADPMVTMGQATNILWVVIGAILVIFMQAGFALVETGFTQKKNAAHVMSTNFAIFGLGFVGFLFVGFPLAFGGFDASAYLGPTGAAMNTTPLIGSGNWAFLWQGWSHLGSGAGAWRSSCTWSPSWTPWPPSPPARWPSVGSGRAS